MHFYRCATTTITIKRKENTPNQSDENLFRPHEIGTSYCIYELVYLCSSRCFPMFSGCSWKTNMFTCSYGLAGNHRPYWVLVIDRLRFALLFPFPLLFSLCILLSVCIPSISPTFFIVVCYFKKKCCARCASLPTWFLFIHIFRFAVQFRSEWDDTKGHITKCMHSPNCVREHEQHTTIRTTTTVPRIIRWCIETNNIENVNRMENEMARKRRKRNTGSPTITIKQHTHTQG